MYIKQFAITVDNIYDNSKTTDIYLFFKIQSNQNLIRNRTKLNKNETFVEFVDQLFFSYDLQIYKLIPQKLRGNLSKRLYSVISDKTSFFIFVISKN